MSRKLLTLSLFCLIYSQAKAQEPAFKLKLREAPIEEVKKRDLLEIGYVKKGLIAQNVNPLYDNQQEQAILIKAEIADSMLVHQAKIKLFLDSLPVKVRVSLYLPKANGKPGKRIASELISLKEDLKRSTLIWDLRYYQIRWPEEGLFVAIANQGKKEDSFAVPNTLNTVLLDTNLMYERSNDGTWKTPSPMPTMSGKGYKWWNAKVSLVLKPF